MGKRRIEADRTRRATEQDSRLSDHRDKGVAPSAQRGDGQPLVRALLVGSRANSYSAIELRWRKQDGVGLSARGRERETSRKGAAPAAASAESARQVPCPAWAEPG